MSNNLGDFTENCGRECPGRTGQDYTYDANGNMISDLNKVITADNFPDPGIKYNHLNLPKEINFFNMGQYQNKGNISFLYDAFGNKLQKKVIDNSASTQKTTITDYVNGFIYEDGLLKQITHEEGRIRWAMQPDFSRKFIYDWVISNYKRLQFSIRG